jgi:hypothetical protein
MKRPFPSGISLWRQNRARENKHLYASKQVPEISATYARSHACNQVHMGEPSTSA